MTVTTNRGIKVRLFEEMDDAKAWLKAERAALESGLDTPPASARTLHGTTE